MEYSAWRAWRNVAVARSICSGDPALPTWRAAPWSLTDSLPQCHLAEERGHRRPWRCTRRRPLGFRTPFVGQLVSPTAVGFAPFGQPLVFE